MAWHPPDDFDEQPENETTETAMPISEVTIKPCAFENRTMARSPFLSDGCSCDA